MSGQLQSLQNQIDQITQLYRNTAQPVQPAAPLPGRQVIQVQGWRGIEDFRLNPGESVLAQDADTNIIFFKSCDANGATRIKALEWNDVTERYTSPAPDTTNYVSKTEFNDFKNELLSLVSEYMKGDKTE